MKPVSIMVAAQIAQEVISKNQTVDRIINDAAQRAEDVADFLEEIEIGMKEDDND